MLTSTKKTRFKITKYVNSFFALLAMYSAYAELETLATTCIAGMLTITTAYMGSDAYRKSETHE